MRSSAAEKVRLLLVLVRVPGRSSLARPRLSCLAPIGSSVRGDEGDDLREFGEGDGCCGGDGGGDSYRIFPLDDKT